MLSAQGMWQLWEQISSLLIYASINITNINSFMANYLLTVEEALQMAGFTFSYSEMDPIVQVPTASKTLLHISDSKFYDNNGGGFHFQLLDIYSYAKYQVIIKNCSLKRNVNPAGSGFDIFHTSVISSKSDIEVLVQDTSFTNHNIVIPEPISLKQIVYQINVFTVKNFRHVKIINCTFAMNTQTALHAFDSTLYFGGHVIFSGNNGMFGGALMLQGGSKIYLMPDTHVQIINNHAKRGGGIYIDDKDIINVSPCFFQLMDLHYPYSEIDSVITLENNTADEAGWRTNRQLLSLCQHSADYTWIPKCI